MQSPVTVTAAILSTGSLTWKAEAATWLETSQLRVAAENYAPIQKAACWPGHHDFCPYHMKHRHGTCLPCVHGYY